MSEISIVSEIVKKIRSSIQEIIVGKDDQINTAIIAILCRGHVLIDDVPGTGKTSLSKALADSLDCSFNRVQFTPDLMPCLPKCVWAYFFLRWQKILYG